VPTIHFDKKQSIKETKEQNLSTNEPPKEQKPQSGRQQEQLTFLAEPSCETHALIQPKKSVSNLLSQSRREPMDRESKGIESKSKQSRSTTLAEHPQAKVLRVRVVNRGNEKTQPGEESI